MKHVEGATAPFPFYSWCGSAQRQEALLSHALTALQAGWYADALWAVEAVCRHGRKSSLPAILRAKLVQVCQPSLAAKAWYQAWMRDPEEANLQDALLGYWLQIQAHQKVLELGAVLLPGRCQRGNEAGLLNLLQQAGGGRIAACWLEDEGICGRVFDLNAVGPSGNLIMTDEHGNSTVLALNQCMFSLPRPAQGRIFSLVLQDGSLVQGSPLIFPDQAASAESSAAAESAKPLKLTKPVKSIKPSKLKPPPGVDIIVPVYRGFSEVQACLASVMQSMAENQTPMRLIVVDDASPEPALSAWLDQLAQREQCILLRNPYNLGFVESVNRGLQQVQNNDVVLLNADTLVQGSWIDRLRRSLYAAADLASVTPWSNNGEISSFPDIARAANAPNLAQLTQLNQVATALALPDLEIPVCCGFTMMLRCSVLKEIGALDGAGFGRGYGEEVDWCLRASAAGFRHHLSSQVFVAHIGGVSFGVEKVLRVRQNRAVLTARYPDFYRDYDKFILEDGLSAARQAYRASIEQQSSLAPAPAPAKAWLQAQEPLPLQFIPASLPAQCPRLAVWQFDARSPMAVPVLALARYLASQSEISLRLLICGDITEALWHTGVVDHLPRNSAVNPLFSDLTLIGLCACIGVLAQPGQWQHTDLPYYEVSDGFDIAACLDQLINNTKQCAPAPI
jgi:GT2 family glycosyltransferase